MSIPVVAVLWIVLALFAKPVSAQRASHAAEIARLRFVVDSIEPQIVALKTLDSLRADSIRKAEARTFPMRVDTIRVGPFTVIGTPSDLRRTRGDAERAWSTVQPMFAGLEAAVTDTVIAITVNTVPYEMGKVLKPTTRVVTVPTALREKWESMIGGQMTAMLTRRLPASLRVWLGSGVIGASIYPNEAYSQLVLGAANHNANPSRNCLEHDVIACKQALGLVPSAVTQPQILLRASLITFAVFHATPGALKTATSDTSDVVAALEHISGRNIDDLLTSWADAVQTETHRGFNHPLRNVISTVFWTLALAALAMRSTRWRLG